MFPIKSLRKPLVTGALLFPHKRKVMRFAQSPERRPGWVLPRLPGAPPAGLRDVHGGPGPRKLCGRGTPHRQGIVGNLSNLPETEKIAPKRGCACATEKGTFVATFLETTNGLSATESVE